MKILHRMILRDFAMVFTVTLLFFLLILGLADLFANLWRYIDSDLSFERIMHIQMLFVPKSFSYALPVSVLFSVAYILGTYYQNNELIAIFSSGISLIRLVYPYMILGILLSVANFFIEDHVVVPTYAKKNKLYRLLLGQSEESFYQNVTIIGAERSLVYSVGSYDPNEKRIYNVTVVKRDEKGRMLYRIEAEKGIWNDDHWILEENRYYRWKGEEIEEQYFDLYVAEDLKEPPHSFREVSQDIGEMTLDQINLAIARKRRSGLATREIRTEYYKRYSFSCTPLIVVLLSCAMAGRVRKNILLTSLLLSLFFSVVYYVFQMMTSLLAKFGLLPPLVGAWLAFLLTGIGAIWLLKKVRT